MQREYRNDIALLKLSTEISNGERILPLCSNFLPPFETLPHVLGSCGKGTTSRTHYDIPYVLQEAFFYESLFESNTQPLQLQFCREDQVCVESATPGTALFHYLFGNFFNPKTSFDHMGSTQLR